MALETDKTFSKQKSNENQMKNDTNKNVPVSQTTNDPAVNSKKKG